MPSDEQGFLTDEELYKKLETTILSLPEVARFTVEGFQTLMQGIDYALGRKGHRGLLIRENKDHGIEIDISLALKSGCPVLKTAEDIQQLVRSIFAMERDNPIREVNVTVTAIVP